MMLLPRSMISLSRRAMISARTCLTSNYSTADETKTSQFTVPVETNEETGFQLSPKKYVKVNVFNDIVLVTIREWFMNVTNRTMVPGQKGISLTVAQYQALKNAIPAIDKIVDQYQNELKSKQQ